MRGQAFEKIKGGLRAVYRALELPSKNPLADGGTLFSVQFNPIIDKTPRWRGMRRLPWAMLFRRLQRVP